MDYKDTKLVAFLQTFTGDELAEFEKFITSPYFRKGRDLLPLFKVIIKHHPDFNPEMFTEEIIFHELHPEADFGNKKSKDILKTLSSSLLKMAEEFLVISNFKKNEVLKNRTLLEELLDRNLLRYYNQYSEIADKELNSKGDSAGQTLLENYFLEGINTRYYSNILDYKNYFYHCVKSGEFISSHFLSNLLRIAKLKYLSEAGRNIKSGSDIVDHLLEGMNMKDILKIFEGTSHFAVIGFHYFTYLSLINNCDFKHYYHAKEIFFGNKLQFSRLEKYYFYSDLLNILNMSLEVMNNLEVRKEIFNLLGSCIDDKAYKLSDEDFIQPDFYRNVILSAVYFNEFGWADNFINNYTKDLKPVYRENLKYYSRALISFGKEEFEEALVNISKVKYDLVNFKIDVKVLSLKIFYELKLTEQAFSMIDTFKHYLKSFQELPDELKSAYSNFLKYYVKLLNMRDRSNPEDASYVMKEINKEDHMGQKTWLLEKFRILQTF